MDIGTIVMSATIFGIFVGVFFVLIFIFIKTKMENRKALKGHPNLVRDIELNKELNKKIQDGRIKKVREVREREREQNGLDGGRYREDDSGEAGTDQQDRGSADKIPSPERDRVPIPKPRFTLSDKRFVIGNE